MTKHIGLVIPVEGPVFEIELRVELVHRIKNHSSAEGLIEEAIKRAGR